MSVSYKPNDPQMTIFENFKFSFENQSNTLKIEVNRQTTKKLLFDVNKTTHVTRFWVYNVVKQSEKLFIKF